MILSKGKVQSLIIKTFRKAKKDNYFYKGNSARPITQTRITVASKTYTSVSDWNRGTAVAPADGWYFVQMGSLSSGYVNACYVQTAQGECRNGILTGPAASAGPVYARKGETVNYGCVRCKAIYLIYVPSIEPTKED